MLRYSLFILAVITVVWLGFGNATLGDPSALQERAEVALSLTTNELITQTFVPQRDNFSAVAVRLDAPVKNPQPLIAYRLFELAATPRLVAAGRGTRGQGEDTAYYFFTFPAQVSSHDTAYALQIENADEPLTVWLSTADEYAAGKATATTRVFSGDLAFKLYYQYTVWIFLSDLFRVLTQHGYESGLALLLFILPGLAIWRLCSTGELMGPLDQLGIAVGLSVASAPIGLSIITWLGQHLSPQWLWLWLISCGCVLVFVEYKQRAKRQTMPMTEWDWAMLGLLGASLCLSLVLVRELRFPLWTDSYHHTLITQLIIERGQIPSSYSPYYPFEQFTYHFGFHTIAAFFAELTQRPTPQAVILVGQIINTLTGLSLYVCMARLTNSRRTAFFAAALVLLVNHVPALYVKWGRYAQLTGQMLLPLCLIVFFEALRTRAYWRWMFLTVILWTGLFFIHYRVTIFGVMFVVAYGLAHSHLLTQTQAWFGNLARRLLGIGGASLLLAGPWLWRVSQEFLTDLFFPSTGLRQVVLEGIGRDGYYDFQLSSIFEYGVTPLVCLLAVSGLWLGLKRRDKLSYSVMLWLGLLISGAYTYLIGLGLYSLTIVTIMLYLPMALLGAMTCDWLWLSSLQWLNRLNPTSLMGWLRLTSCVGLFTLFGLRQLSATRLENGFVRPADEQAIAWIKVNTPANTRFLMSWFFWRPTVVEGRDAGWWLPLLANRSSALPTQLYFRDASPDYMLQTNRLFQQLSHPIAPAQIHAILQAHNIHYIYIGQRPAVLQPHQFLDSPGYHLVYHTEGVWIFEVD